MGNLKNIENVRIDVSYTPKEMVFIFREGQDYAKSNRNDDAYTMNVMLGKKLYKENKHLSSELETLVGHKIENSDDFVAFSLTVQALVFQQKMNEFNFGGIR